MGMKTYKNLCHYIKLEEAIDDLLEDELYREYADKFRLVQGLDNIILSNFSSFLSKSQLDDNFAYTLELTDDLVKEDRKIFEENTHQIRSVLLLKGIKYKVEFGLVQYFG